MLVQVSTPATIGRVSGFGWSMGYFGGIVLLLRRLRRADRGRRRRARGVRPADGFNIRLVALVAAAWFAVFAIPLFVRGARAAARRSRRRPAGRHRLLPRSCVHRPARRCTGRPRTRSTSSGASALFRDGLAAMFTFGAVLAVTVYGIDEGDVLIFGVVAERGRPPPGALTGRRASTTGSGPKAVIVISLLGLLVAGAILLFVSGPAMFWVFGLFLTPVRRAGAVLVADVPCAAGAARAARASCSGSTPPRAGRCPSWPRRWWACAPRCSARERAGIVGILVVLAAGLWRSGPGARPARRRRSRREPEHHVKRWVDDRRDLSHSSVTRHIQVCERAGWGTLSDSGRQTSGGRRVSRPPGGGTFRRREQTTALQTLHPCVSAGRGSLGPVNGRMTHGRPRAPWQPARGCQLRDRPQPRPRAAAVDALRVPARARLRGALRDDAEARPPGSAACTAASPGWSTAPSPSRRRSSPRARTGTCCWSAARWPTSRCCSPSASSCSRSGAPRSPDAGRIAKPGRLGRRRLRRPASRSTKGHLTGPAHSDISGRSLTRCQPVSARRRSWHQRRPSPTG